MSKPISSVAIISACVGVLGLFMALAGFVFGAGEAKAVLSAKVEEHDRQIQILLKDRDTIIAVATTVQMIDKRLESWEANHRKP